MDEALKDVLEAIDKAKGYDTVVFHVSEQHPFLDYIVITSASNSRQIQALADYVKKALIEKNHGYRHLEGNDTSKWILVDSDQIVVHVFDEHEREVYALEKLYAACERIV